MNTSMNARAAIAATSFLGLATVAVAARYYAGVDALPFLVTLLMGGAMAAGALELLAATGHCERLLAELTRHVRALQSAPEQTCDALARPQDEPQSDARAGSASTHAEPAPNADDETPTPAETLASMGPALGAVVRARLDRAGAPIPQAVFSPYLIGLLVMLGLLGTFLGLFETLRGASLALAADAGDADALRAGMQTPVRGLMRAFGTSAAGVASSAMLGLGAVFARRAHQRLGLSVEAAVAGPLASLSPAHRNLAALEALSAQGAAWPAAVRSLEAATQSLTTIKSGFEGAQARAAEELTAGARRASQALEQGMQSLVADLRTALEVPVARAVEQAVQALQPLVAESVKGTVGATTEHLSAVRGLVDRQMAEHRSAQLQASETFQQRVRALLDRLAELEEARAARDGGELERLAGSLRELSEREGERHAALFAHFEQTAERLRTALSEQSAQDEQRARSLAQVASRVHDDLGKAAVAVSERMAEGARSELEHRARFEAVFEQLEAAASAFNATTREQAQQLQTFVGACDVRLADAEHGAEARLSKVAEQLHENALAQAEHGRKQAEQLAAIEQAVVTQHGESTAQLAALLTEQVASLDERLRYSGELLERASGMVQAGGAELVTVAETFAEAVEKQRAAAQQWLDSLGEIERSVTDAGEAAAADVLGQHLARTHEVFDRQLRFQQELIDQLRRDGQESTSGITGAAADA